MPDLAEKIMIAMIAPVLTIMLAWMVGQRMSAAWGEKQKRRELELALAESFYSSYGEFCALWKEWNWYCDHFRDAPTDVFSSRQLALLERACRAEGAMEAVLLKIAAERTLTPDERVDLGNLRQAFQVLRERIQEATRISYGSSEHEDYLEFKRLATFIGNLLASRRGALPTHKEAYESFREITNNKHEPRWHLAGRSGR